MNLSLREMYYGDHTSTQINKLYSLDGDELGIAFLQSLIFNLRNNTLILRPKNFV